MSSSEDKLQYLKQILQKNDKLMTITLAAESQEKSYTLFGLTSTLVILYT